MKRVFSAALLMLLLCGCGASSVPAATEPTPTVAETITEPTTEPTTAPTEPPEQRYTFTFAGDCTLGVDKTHVKVGYGFLLTVGEDYAYPFRNVLEYFENDDFTMVNLEGVLGERGGPVSKRYTFRGPSSYVNILTQNSIEAVSLANNHTLDYGQEGFAETKAILDEAHITYVEANNSTIVTLDGGLTVGLYGTVYNNVDPEQTEEAIEALKEQGVDLVIYAPHWGVEHTFYPTDEQVEQGYAAIDAGADIVFGCHPHVLQPIEEYGDGVIFYSLGNFSFGGNIYPSDYDTAIIQQEVIFSADGSVRLGERTLIPCNMSSIDSRNNFQPTPYAVGTEEYDRTISKLDGSYTGPNLPVS